MGQQPKAVKMWTKNPDGTYTIERSEWENSSFNDPITGRTVYASDQYLTTHKDADNDVTYWTGTFPSGARVIIYND